MLENVFMMAAKCSDWIHTHEHLDNKLQRHNTHTLTHTNSRPSALLIKVHKQPSLNTHLKPGQLWHLCICIHVYTHIHTQAYTRRDTVICRQDGPVCRELSTLWCWYLHTLSHKCVFHLPPLSLTDIGSVLYSLEFDTVAALITFLVLCQANSVNPWI